MKDNDMREAIEDKKTGLGPPLAYKMRKGLLKERKKASYQYRADGDDAES